MHSHRQHPSNPGYHQTLIGKEGILRPPGAVPLTFLIALFFLLFLLPGSALASPDTPQVENGLLDLSNWNSGTSESLQLNGGWDFYWGKYLPPTDWKKRLESHNSNSEPATGASNVNNESRRTIRVPGSWTSTEENYPARGQASYRLIIELPDDAIHEGLALSLPTIGSAYKLYVNGELLHALGNTDSTEESMTEALKPALVSLPPLQARNEILFHVANVEHRHAGLWLPIQLGSRELLTEANQRSNALNLFLAGGLVLIGIYHLGLFLARRKELTALYFGLFCLCVSVWSAQRTDKLFAQLIPDLSGHIGLRLEYLGFYLSVFAFLQFARHMYPGEMLQWPRRIINALAGIAVVLGLILPVRHFVHTLPVMQIDALAAVLLCSLWAMLAVVRKRLGAKLVGLSFLLLGATVVNDILVAAFATHDLYIAPFGLMFFIVGQAFALSMHLSRAFNKLEDLSQNLEQKVEQRTAELDTLNDLTRRVNESRDLQYIVEQTSAYMVRQLGMRRMFLLLIDEQENEIQGYGGQVEDTSDEERQFYQSLRAKIEPELGTLYRTIKKKKTLHLDLQKTGTPAAAIDRRVVEQFQMKSILEIPALVGNRVLGVAIIDPGDRRLNREEISRLESVVSQIAGAASNAQLIRQINEQRWIAEKEQADSEILAELAQQANRGNDAGGLLGPLARVLISRLGADRLGMWLARDDGFLHLVAGYSDGRPTDPSIYSDTVVRISTGEEGGVLARGYREGRTIYAPRVNLKILQSSPVDREIQSTWKFDWFVNLPLLLEGRSVGMIAASGPRSRRIPRNEMKFLERAAATVAGATQKQILLEKIAEEKNQAESLRLEAEREKEESELLADMARESNRGSGIESLLTPMARVLKDRIEADRLGLWIVSKEGGLELEAGFVDGERGSPEDYDPLVAHIPARAESTLTHVQQSGRTLYAPRVSAAILERSAVDRKMQETWKFHWSIVLPLAAAKGVIGVIAASGPKKRRLAREEIRFLERAADTFSGVLQKQKLLESVEEEKLQADSLRVEAEREKEESELLAELARETNQGASIDELLSPIYRASRSRIRARNVALYLVDQGGSRLVFRCGYTAGKQQNDDAYPELIRSVPVSDRENSLVRCYLRGRSLFQDRIDTELMQELPVDQALYEHWAYGWLALVPLTLKGQSIGIIAWAGEDRSRMSRSDMPFLESVADIITGALHNLQLLEQVQEKQSIAEQEAQATEMLADLSRKALEGGKLEEVVRSLSDFLKPMLGYHGVTIYFPDDSAEALVQRTVMEDGKTLDIGSLPDPVRVIPMVPGSGSLHRVFRRGKPMYFPEITDELQANSPVDKAIRQYFGFNWCYHLPMTVSEKVIGIATIAGHSQKQLSPKERVIIQRMIAQVAGAVQQQSLLQTIEQEKDTAHKLEQETRALADFTRRLNERQELGSIVREVCRFAVESLDLRGAFITAVKEKEKEFQNIGGFGKDYNDQQILFTDNATAPLNQEAGIAYRTYKRRKRLYLRQLPELENPTDRYVTELLGLRSYLQVPLILRGDVIGIMGIDPGQRQLSREDLDRLQRYADQVTGAINNAALLKEVQAQRMSIEGLARITETAASTDNLDEILNQIFQYVRDRYGILSGIVMVPNEDRTELQSIKVHTFEDKDKLQLHEAGDYGETLSVRIDTEGGTLARTFLRGRPFYVPDVERLMGTERNYPGAKIDRDIFHNLRYRGYLALPMQVNKEPVALLNFTSYGEELKLSKTDREELFTLASQLAGIIRSRQLAENLEKEKRIAERERSENASLAALARYANEGTGIQDILIQTSQFTESECGVSRLGLYLVDNERNTLELHSVLQSGIVQDLADAPESIRSIPITFENGSLPAVIRRKRKMFLPHIKQAFLDASPVDADQVAFHKFDWLLHAPMSIEGSIVGILVFVGPHQRRPGLPERQLMERIVDQISGAVQSKRLLAQVEEARIDSEALAELARRADEGADLTEIGELVLQYANDKCGVDTLALYTLNEDKNRLEARAMARKGQIQSGDTIPEEVRFPSMAEDTGTLRRVVSTGKPMYMGRIPDRMRKKMSGHDRRLMEYLGFDWFLDIPMVAEGRVIGVIAFAGPSRQKLSKSERDFLERITRQVSGSVQNRQLLKEVESERNVARTLQKETEGLNQLLKRIAPMEDLEEIMAEVIRFSEEAYGIGVYSLYSVDNEARQMHALSMNFPDHIASEDREHIMATPIPLDYRGGAFTMAYRRSPRYSYYRTVNPEPLPPIEQFVTEKYGITNMVVYPLMEGSQVMAFLNFLTYNPEGLKRDQLSQLSILSDQISGIIRMNGLIREVKEQSTRTEAARRETEVLADLSRKANEATDLESVSHTLFDHLRESLDLDDFCLFVLEPETMLFHAAAWDTRAADNPKTRKWLETTQYKMEPEIGSLYRTYSRRKTTYLPSFPDEFTATGDRAIVEKLNLKSALQVPLLIQDEVIGFFTCGPRRRLWKAEIHSIERFCNQVAGAIRATALLKSTALEKERAESARQETEVLAELSKQANETSSLQNLCETLFDNLKEQYGIENQALFVVDNETYELTPAAARGGVGPEERQRWLNTFRINLKNDPGTMSSTYKRQKTFYIKQIPKRLEGKDLEIVETLNPRTILQVPLVLQDRTVGIMVADPAKELTKADITFIERMCDQIAGAVRTTALLQTTQEAREEAVVAKEEAEVARAESDALLENVLPSITAKELKESGRVEPVYFDNVSVLFTDFVGFTKAAAKLSPAELIQELDGCFSQFDEVSRRNNMEKLKTIGDAYMCAGGLPVPDEGHAIDACLTALEFRSFMNQMAEVKGQLGFEFWQIRIGIHSGPVTAGVIGKNKFSYDIWGDTVNTASRMESSGSPGTVNISGETYELVKDLFECEYRGKVQAKGKGELDMYFVHRIKPELSADEEGLLPNAMFEMARTDLDMDELEAIKAEAHNGKHGRGESPASGNGQSVTNETGEGFGIEQEYSTHPRGNQTSGMENERRQSDRRSGGERRKPAGARPLSEIDNEREGW